MTKFEPIEKEIRSTDGIHTLRGLVAVPEGEVKAVLQISHGMIEHIRRYLPFMEFLASNGYVVCGHDHLGHGNTAEKGGLGYFAKKDGWKTVIDDVHVFGEAVMQDFPGKPHVLLGHSMGSFIARNTAAHYPKDFDALIIMGTGGPNPASGAGLALTSIIRFFCGEKHISKLAENAAFSSFNKRTGSDNPYAWLTHDETMLAEHDADPLCMFKFTVSAMHDLVHLQSEANKKKWFRSIRREMPVFIVSGDEDPVGSYGKGVRTVYEGLRRAGVSDLRIKLYPGMRHEILNETGREEVYGDLLRWLDEKT